MDVMIGSTITTRIKMAGAMPGPWGTVLKKGVQPKRLCSRLRAGRIAGSITKMAQSPSTTEGMAASSSTIKPIASRRELGIRSSVIKIAVPTPKGMAIAIDRIELTNVP